MPSVSMRQLLEAGVHFGHQTRRWNPKMRPFIFAERNGIHIIDLAQTVQRLEVALEFVRETVARGDQILFVGTKKQAQEPIAAEATRADMPYVNQRWLGGMLTNFVTIKKRIGLLDQLEARQQNGDFERMTKKEAAKLTEELTKLQGTLGGIRKMKRLPGAIFIIDPHRERIAVTEANKLEIPVIGTGDTNVDPDELDYIIPANDDAIRAIRLLCSLVADAAIEGAQRARRPGATEPEPIEAMAMPETEEEGASDELVAALAGGAALRFEPEPTRTTSCPATASPEPRRPSPRHRPRRPPRRSPPSSPAKRPRRTTRAARRPADPAPATSRPTTTSTPHRRRSGTGRRRQENEQAWPTSPRSWSRSCASAPAPASWTASARSRRPTATSTRPSRCCASRAWRRPPRRPAATPARASSRATSTPAAGSACSSRSTARPTSWPAPTSSRSSSATWPCRSPGSRRCTSTTTRSRPTCSRPSRPSCSPTRRVQKKPENIRDQIVDGQLKKWY